MTLEDDKGVLPGRQRDLHRRAAGRRRGRPRLRATIEKVQEHLTLEVMQELNARVDIDKEKPEQAAQEYLQESGYTD